MGFPTESVISKKIMESRLILLFLWLETHPVGKCIRLEKGLLLSALALNSPSFNFPTQFNEDDSVHGILVQLPLPKELLHSKSQILSSILSSKDVDNLTDQSTFTHPTSLAILDILENSLLTSDETKILLIGYKGFVGSKTLELLKHHKYNIKGVDIETVDLTPETLKADIIISATGTPNIIDQSMVKKGVSLIDIGYPAGDFNADVSHKAQFMTPIKNGVGPVTIAYLLENLVSAAENNIAFP